MNGAPSLVPAMLSRNAGPSTLHPTDEDLSVGAPTPFAALRSLRMTRFEVCRMRMVARVVGNRVCLRAPYFTASRCRRVSSFCRWRLLLGRRGGGLRSILCRGRLPASSLLCRWGLAGRDRGRCCRRRFVRDCHASRAVLREFTAALLVAGSELCFPTSQNQDTSSTTRGGSRPFR